MSTRAKGWRAKREVIRKLEDEGCFVEDVEKSRRFVAGSRDLFGLFDVLALDKSPGFVQVRFVQVSHKTHVHDHRSFVEFIKKYNAHNFSIEQWVRVYGGFEIYRYYSDGTYTHEKKDGSITNKKLRAKQ